LASAAPNCEDKDKDKPPQLILHLREDGEPWTYDGFKTAWQREMNREVFARFREERIVFHGLRKNGRTPSTIYSRSDARRRGSPRS
jgi:hypothetical protein